MNSGTLKLPAASTTLVDTPEDLAKSAHISSPQAASHSTPIHRREHLPARSFASIPGGHRNKRVELLDPIAIGRGRGQQLLWRPLAGPGIAGKNLPRRRSGRRNRLAPLAATSPGICSTRRSPRACWASPTPTALWRGRRVYHQASTLGKAFTCSAWNRRPLSKAQFAYAIDDVRYLLGHPRRR